MTTPEKKQEETINAVRRLIQVKEPVLHRIPSWLTKRLRAFGRRQHVGGYSAEMIMQSYMPCSMHWLDHWGTLKPGCCCSDAAAFVSEPYGLTDKDAKEVTRFCEALGGLSWHVEADSWWYPGSTVRIVIHDVRTEKSAS